MLGWAEWLAAAGLAPVELAPVGLAAVELAAPGACRTTDVVVTPLARVAGGMTEVRSWVTRLAVAVAAGRVVGMTLNVIALPFLLMSGGDTLSTPAGVISAFCSFTRRGSVPRASPPA